MEKMKILILFAISFMIMGCPEPDEYQPDEELQIMNNSAEALIHFTTFSELSDTLLSQSNPFNNIDLGIFTVESNSSKIIDIDTGFLEESGGLHIHFFSRDTVEQVPWERIRDEYLVLRRYDLTLEDLEAMNWIIEYP